MRQITNFLGLEPFPQSVAKKEWEVFGVTSKIKNMNGKSFERLSNEDIQTIEKIAGQRLELHGYATPP